jgi:hypothetical protein
MALNGEDGTDPGTTYVTRFDGVRVPACEYRPVWVGNLASDVTIEGSAMNGVVQGADAVRSIVTYIRTLYDSRCSTSPGLMATTDSWRTTPPRSAASRSAMWCWSPAMPRDRRSTSWPTPDRGLRCCSCPGWWVSISRGPRTESTSRPALRSETGGGIARTRVRWDACPVTDAVSRGERRRTPAHKRCNRLAQSPPRVATRVSSTKSLLTASCTSGVDRLATSYRSLIACFKLEAGEGVVRGMIWAVGIGGAWYAADIRTLHDRGWIDQSPSGRLSRPSPRPPQ